MDVSMPETNLVTCLLESLRFKSNHILTRVQTFHHAAKGMSQARARNPASVVADPEWGNLCGCGSGEV